MLFALSMSVEAQQLKRVPRIGVLSSFSPPVLSGRRGPFRQGLSDLGYVEGKNIVIEYRYLEGKGDRIRSLVAELVQLKVDVLVLSVYGAIRIAKQATNTIPIVMVSSQDPRLRRDLGNGTTRDLVGDRTRRMIEKPQDS